MNNNGLVIYRKRILPEECIRLKDDIILKQTDDYIITKWNTLKPKEQFNHGYSCYFLKEGIKLSRFIKEDESLNCWYLDFVEYSFDREGDTDILTVTDLLVDVIISPEDEVKVVDIDELKKCLDEGEISGNQLINIISSLAKVFEKKANGEFKRYQEILENEIG